MIQIDKFIRLNVQKIKHHMAGQHFKNRSPLIPSSLELLAKKRKGGRVNIRGIEYQLQFSIHMALKELLPEHSDTAIRLEGIEDLDVLNKLRINDGAFYQVKFSQDEITSSKLWNLGVIQNFIETHLIDEHARFILIVNRPYTDSKLDVLFKGDREILNLEHWRNKINSLRLQPKQQGWLWDNFNLDCFLKSLSIEIVDDTALRISNETLIIEKFSLTKSSYILYLNALFHYIFQASKVGESITIKSINNIIDSVKCQIATGVTNPALQFRLIEQISFDPKHQSDLSSYFDGQPAQPIHIAASLPVNRPKLEKKIFDHLEQFGCAIIKSSSGQGKSTLAWQTCYNLFLQDRDIYQLHSCESAEHVGALVEFIETKVLIGQAPILVIDGLSSKFKNWADLASRLAEAPVKVIITSREEDWARFGNDAYRITMGEPINPEFSRTEAQLIFKELKHHNRLHPSCTNWQSAWESVEEKGLLMEYVYLVTRGQMLVDRLKSQLSHLHNERDGGAKLRILRIVSFADYIGIKIGTEVLGKHIKNNVLLQGDLGEILNQLESEYYVRFDRVTIEGLHPVRSEHLSSLLHARSPVSETLLDLAEIVTQNDCSALGVAISKFLDTDDEKDFFQNLTRSLGSDPNVSISELLFGIYQGEIMKYWANNKDIFDNTFIKGGYPLLALATIPFPTKEMDILGTISLLNEKNHIQEAAKLLPKFAIEDTFLKVAVEEVFNFTVEKNFSIVDVYKLQLWFTAFNHRHQFPNDEFILEVIKKLNLTDSMDFVSALYSIDSHLYQEFGKSNLISLIDILKAKTESINVQVNDNTVLVEYVLTDSQSEFANRESMMRIDSSREFLPFLRRYETKARMFPFPNTYIIQPALTNAYKSIESKTLLDPFLIKLNRIWNTELNSRYRSTSMYDWQEKYYILRQAAVACAKSSCHLIKTILGGHAGTSKLDKAIGDWDIASNHFLSKNRTLPSFPANIELGESKNDKLAPCLATIQDWSSSYSNFVNQYAGLLKLDQPETRRLAMLNIKSAVFKLPLMQGAFDQIVKETYNYFDLTGLKKEESLWYSRLLKNSTYYGEHVNNASFKRLNGVDEYVASYWLDKTEARYQRVLRSIDEFSKKTGFFVHAPSQLIDEEFLSRAVLGIEGFGIAEFSENFEIIARELATFSATDLDFLTIFACKDRKASIGWRFRRDFFEKVSDINEGRYAKLGEEDGPLPIVPSFEELITLTDIYPAENQNLPLTHSIFEFYEALWLWKTYQLSLRDDFVLDKAWKSSKIEFYKSKLMDLAANFQALLPPHVWAEMKVHLSETMTFPDKCLDKTLSEQALSTLEKVSLVKTDLA